VRFHQLRQKEALSNGNPETTQGMEKHGKHRKKIGQIGKHIEKNMVQNRKTRKNIGKNMGKK
jgi:hypothetical protein